MRPGEVHRPLPNHRVVKPFHDLGEMNDRNDPRDFPALLPFRENFTEQAGRDFLELPQIRRPHRIHRPGQHDGLPQPPVGFRSARKALIEAAQAFPGSRFTGEFRLELLADAGVASRSYFSQNGVLAGKIAEKSRLADLQNPHNVVHPRLLIAALAEQLHGGLDDLLAKPRLLAFTEPGCLALLCCSRGPGEISLGNLLPFSPLSKGRGYRYALNRLGASHGPP